MTETPQRSRADRMRAGLRVWCWTYAADDHRTAGPQQRKLLTQAGVFL